MLLRALVLAVKKPLHPHVLRHRLQFALAQLVLLQIHHLHLHAALLEEALRLLRIEILLADIKLNHALFLLTSSPKNCSSIHCFPSSKRDVMRSV